MGAEGRVCLGPLLLEDPFPADAQGLGWDPLHGREDSNPSLGTAPTGGNRAGGGPAPRPTPSPAVTVWDRERVA